MVFGGGNGAGFAAAPDVTLPMVSRPSGTRLLRRTRERQHFRAKRCAKRDGQVFGPSWPGIEQYAAHVRQRSDLARNPPGVFDSLTPYAAQPLTLLTRRQRHVTAAIRDQHQRG